MISEEEVKKLASLARIELTTKEVVQYAEDMGEILEFVKSVKGINNDAEKSQGLVKNVLRGDSNIRESGVYTEEVLNNAPKKQKNYFVVKKIIEK